MHCQGRFVEKRNFDIHLKYDQACRDANLQCGKCGELFTSVTNLHQHIRRHKQSYHRSSTYSRSQEIPKLWIPLSTRDSLISQEVSYSTKSQTLVTSSDSKRFHCTWILQ